MNNSQKQSIYHFMKKSLRKEYFYLKRELLLYCPVDFGVFSTNAYYATLDKDGMSIYQYDKNVESRVRLVHRYAWKDWNFIKADHFFQKSRLLFQGKHNLTLQVLQNGKEFVQIIQQSTSMQVETVRRPLWRKLPGFRYNTTISTYITSIFYTLFIAFVLRLVLPYQGELFMFSLSLLFMLLGVLFLTVGLIDPSIVLPRSRARTRVTAFYYYSYFTICGFVSIFIFW